MTKRVGGADLRAATFFSDDSRAVSVMFGRDGSGGRGRRRKRRERQRGASLVEFGLVAIFLFTLLFGIFEFGLTYNNYQSVRQGARDGARAAVVNNLASAPCTGTPAQMLTCLVEQEVGLDAARTYVMVVTADTPAASDRGRIKVCVQFKNQSVTGFFPFLNNNYLRTRVEMRNERGTAPPAFDSAESLPAGGSWAWC